MLFKKNIENLAAFGGGKIYCQNIDFKKIVFNSKDIKRGDVFLPLKGQNHDVIIAGGVAANKFIRSKFKELEGSLGIKVYYPDLKYCGDNAAMIAFVGSMMSPNKKENNPSQVRARWPLDELKQ